MSVLGNFVDTAATQRIPFKHGSCFVLSPSENFGDPEFSAFPLKGLSQALKTFNRTLIITKHPWRSFPSDADQAGLSEIVSLVGQDFKFAYPKDWTQLIKYLAALGAPSKALTRPDLIVLDKLEDFLCERPPLTVDDTQATIKAKTGKFETHRRLTKILALISGFSVTQTNKEDGMPVTRPQPSSDTTSVLVTFCAPNTCQLTLSELNQVGLWFHETWTCSSSTDDDDSQPFSSSLPDEEGDKKSHEKSLTLTCFSGPLKDTQLQF